MPLVLLWFPFGDLRIFGLAYVSTVCVGMVSSVSGSYFLIFQMCSSEPKPRIQSSAAVLFHSLRWLCVLISVLHPGKGLSSFAKPSEFPTFSTRCCFTYVTCNWLLQIFASLDWARCPFGSGGCLCFSTRCCFMIVTCDWMLRNLFSQLWLDALLR